MCFLKPRFLNIKLLENHGRQLNPISCISAKNIFALVHIRIFLVTEFNYEKLQEGKTAAETPRQLMPIWKDLFLARIDIIELPKAIK